MLVEAALGLGVLFVLAFGNGANDAGKSIVALMTDPETAGFRPSYRALFWGGLFSGLGSVSAILISGRLFAVFQPEKLLGTTPVTSFILAALIGAASWVLLATALRISVSTTHAIIGAIVIQAAYLFGVSNLAWNFLIWSIILPLAAGPFIALIGAYLLIRISRRRRTQEVEGPKHAGKADWGSAAAVAYGRGVNDAPKMAALGAFFLLGTPGEAGWMPYLIVGMAVVVGSLVWGDRVAKTLIGRSAPLHRGRRLKAHTATAALLSAGAYFGDAFSATQMSEGAAAGAGKRGGFLVSSFRSMAMAWLVTFPAAGFLAIAASYFGPMLWG